MFYSLSIQLFSEITRFWYPIKHWFPQKLFLSHSQLAFVSFCRIFLHVRFASDVHLMKNDGYNETIRKYIHQLWASAADSRPKLQRSCCPSQAVCERSRLDQLSCNQSTFGVYHQSFSCHQNQQSAYSIRIIDFISYILH